MVKELGFRNVQTSKRNSNVGMLEDPSIGDADDTIVQFVDNMDVNDIEPIEVKTGKHHRIRSSNNYSKTNDTVNKNHSRYGTTSPNIDSAYRAPRPGQHIRPQTADANRFRRNRQMLNSKELSPSKITQPIVRVSNKSGPQNSFYGTFAPNNARISMSWLQDGGAFNSKETSQNKPPSLKNYR